MICRACGRRTIAMPVESQCVNYQCSLYWQPIPISSASMYCAACGRIRLPVSVPDEDAPSRGESLPEDERQAPPIAQSPAPDENLSERIRTEVKDYASLAWYAFLFIVAIPAALTVLWLLVHAILGRGGCDQDYVGQQPVCR